MCCLHCKSVLLQLDLIHFATYFFANIILVLTQAAQPRILFMENQWCCSLLRDQIKDTLLRDKKRRKKALHPMSIELITSRVLLRRRVLYLCATTAAL